MSDSNHGDCVCDHCLEEARINRERKATDPIGTAQERELIEARAEDDLCRAIEHHSRLDWNEAQALAPILLGHMKQLGYTIALSLHRRPT